MERTYDVFVDNGLFVVANLLNKKIEDLKVEDLKDNTELFTNKIYDFITCNKYSNIKDMSFHNSAFNNPAFKNNRKMKIKEQIDIIMNNVGKDEYCCTCGGKHIKFSQDEEYQTKLNRAFIINCVADTFYNHSNNLQAVNICPICILLGMISTLNMRKSGYVILYNSENYEFMYDLTNRRQRENMQDIESNTKVDDKNTIDIQEEILLFIKEKIIHRNNLKVYKINNGKGEFYEEGFLSNKDLNLLKDLEVEELLHEFNKYGLFSSLLNGILKRVYINRLIDFKDNKLKCSKELITFLERRLNEMSEELNQVIEKVSKAVSGIDNKNCLLELKKVSNGNKFVELILKWVEMYKDKESKDLLTSEEFDLLTDRIKYISIKNKMIFELILNK